MINSLSVKSLTFFLSLVLLNLNLVSFASDSSRPNESAFPEDSEIYIAQNSAVILQTRGVLQRGDRTLDDGSLYHVYTFNGRSGQRITLNLTSNEFDTYLILLDSNGENIADNDDFQGGTNSHITITLPRTGEYSVIVNGYDSSSRGAYELAILESGGNVSNSNSSSNSVDNCQAALDESIYQIERLPNISVVNVYSRST